MRILLATSNPHKLEEIGAVFAAQQASADAAAPLDVELVSLAQLGRTIPEPHEDQPTFEGNAILKARYYARAAGLLCLADDSGLEVDALAGQPGVRSARYAGISGPRGVVDPANNQLLLENLCDVPAEKRSARFVCAMALCQPRSARKTPSPVGRGWPDEVGTGEGVFGDKATLNPATRLPPPGASEERREPDILAIVRGTVEGRILLPHETADPAQPHRGRGLNGFGYDPLFLISELGHTTAELSSQQKNAISHRGRASRLMWQHLQALAPTTLPH